MAACLHGSANLRSRRYSHLTEVSGVSGRGDFRTRNKMNLVARLRESAADKDAE